MLIYEYQILHASVLRYIMHESCIIVSVGEMAELVYGARLERVLGRKALAGSNPVLSAKKTYQP